MEDRVSTTGKVFTCFKFLLYVVLLLTFISLKTTLSLLVSAHRHFLASDYLIVAFWALCTHPWCPKQDNYFSWGLSAKHSQTFTLQTFALLFYFHRPAQLACAPEQSPVTQTPVRGAGREAVLHPAPMPPLPPGTCPCSQPPICFSLISQDRLELCSLLLMCAIFLPLPSWVSSAELRGMYSIPSITPS